MDSQSNSRMRMAAGVIAFGAVMTASSRVDSLPYLPVIGPSSLRLKVPTAGEKYQMRPLTPPNTNTIEPDNLEILGPAMPPAASEKLATPRPPNDAVEITPPEQPAVHPESSEPLYQQSSASAVVTPQMFLRFFNKQNNAEALVPAPVPTNAPASPAKGSSATYTVK